MIKVKLINEGQVVKQISSRVHESVILEQIKRYDKPFDEIVIVEGDLSEDAKGILKKVAKKIVPAAISAGMALGGASGAQAHGTDLSIGQHLSNIFSPNYQEILRQRRAEQDTERRAWDARQAEIRRARVERAREEGRREAQGITGQEMSGRAQVFDQARLSQDGQYYNLYDLNHNVIRVPVKGTEFVPADSQRLSHYITRSGKVYYVRHTPESTQAPQEGLQEDPTVGTIPAGSVATGGTSSSTLKARGTQAVGRSVVAPAAKPGSTPPTPKFAGQASGQAGQGGDENVLNLDKNHGLDQQTLDKLEKAGIQINVNEKGRVMSDLEKRIRGINESYTGGTQSLHEELNPMAHAVVGRILAQHKDWLSQYGVEAVIQAVDDATEGEGDWEEIGSSDISAYVKMVHDRLQDRMGGQDETHWNFGSGTMTEEFGAKYFERLAQDVYNENPNLDTSGEADDLLAAGYELARRELNPKSARHLFAYDEDFPADFIAAYAVLQQGKGIEEGVNVKQIKRDLDSGMSYDAVIGKHANKRLTNTDEIRRVIQQHAWEKRMKKPKEQGVGEAKHFRTAYGWAGGYNEKTGKRYKHPEQVKQDREAKKQEKDQEKKPSVEEGRMKDIDIERQDYEQMSPLAFRNRYHMSKEEWYDQHKSLLEPKKSTASKPVQEGFTDDKLQAILDRYEDAWRSFKSGGDIDENPDFFDELFDYFAHSGEMPYGVAKATTGDPIEWISSKMDTLAGNEKVAEASEDDDMEASPADQAEADRHIIMKLRKASDYDQPTAIKLGDGSTVKVSADTAQKILQAFDRLRPDSKDLMQQTLNTKKGFADIAQHLGEGVMQESLRPGEYHLAKVTLDDGSEETVKIYWDEGFRDQIKNQFARKGKTVKDIKVDWAVRQDFHEEAQRRVAKIMNEVFGL